MRARGAFAARTGAFWRVFGRFLTWSFKDFSHIRHETARPLLQVYALLQYFGHFGGGSLFTRPQCVASLGALPPGTQTGSFLSSSRPSCWRPVSPAAPRRARAATLREVSRCYVAPPHCDVARRRGSAARGRQSESRTHLRSICHESRNEFSFSRFSHDSSPDSFNITQPSTGTKRYVLASRVTWGRYGAKPRKPHVGNCPNLTLTAPGGAWGTLGVLGGRKLLLRTI